ncbi:MAG: DUF29 family protein [Candidatus Kapaibacterium sp.]|nr:MAG: DUF29 family protein [Candidatus Kapabacteria bacterium]
MTGQHNWQELAATSHYQTAVEVRQELYAGNMPEAIMGVTELIDALYRSDKRTLRGQLIRAMKHILKWHLGREYRTTACVVSIASARDEIEFLLEDEPRLAAEYRTYLESLLQRAFQFAYNEVIIETGNKPAITQLSWHEVFEQDYPQDVEFAEAPIFRTAQNGTNT